MYAPGFGIDILNDTTLAHTVLFTRRYHKHQTRAATPDLVVNAAIYIFVKLNLQYNIKIAGFTQGPSSGTSESFWVPIVIPFSFNYYKSGRIASLF